MIQIARDTIQPARPKPTFLQIPEEKRERVLREAARIFAEHGLQQADMGELAARVGVAKGSLYNYFASKEDLFEYVCRDALERSRRAVYGELDPTWDIHRQVEHIFRAGLLFARAHPEYVAMYLSLSSVGMEQFAGKLSLAVEKYTADHLKRVLQIGVEQGVVRADVDVALAAFSINSLYILFMASLASEHYRIRAREYLEVEGDFDGESERHVERIIELINRLLRPAATPAGGDAQARARND